MRLLKTKLLFALATEVDFINKAEGYGYKGYRFLYYRLSEFEKGSIRDAVVRLSREGALDKIVRGNKARFRLTSGGREKMLKKMPIYRGQRQVWDRIWRVVMVSDLGRDGRLVSRKLSELGYKRAGRGVFITPLRVSEATRELFMDKRWSGKAQVIESRKLIVGDDLGLARQLWELDQTASGYLDFISKADRLLKMARSNPVLLQQSKGGFKMIFDGYFRLVLTDPGLPKRLLPEDWPADKAKDLFDRLVILAKTAGI